MPVLIPSFSPTFWHAMIERAFSAPPPPLHGPFVSKAAAERSIYEVAARALKGAQRLRYARTAAKKRARQVSSPHPRRIRSDHCCANSDSSHTRAACMCDACAPRAYAELRNDLVVFGCIPATLGDGSTPLSSDPYPFLFFITHSCKTGTRRIAAS